MSNQLEEIQKLYANVKTYKIPKKPKKGEKQIEVEITPLSLDDLGLVSTNENTSLEESARKTKAMVAKSLGVGEEVVSKISIEFVEDIIAAIADINNFGDEDIKKPGVKEFIKQKREQIEEEKEGGGSDKQS